MCRNIYRGCGVYCFVHEQDFWFGAIAGLLFKTERMKEGAGVVSWVSLREKLPEVEKN